MPVHSKTHVLAPNMYKNSLFPEKQATCKKAEFSREKGDDWKNWEKFPKCWNAGTSAVEQITIFKEGIYQELKGAKSPHSFDCARKLIRFIWYLSRKGGQKTCSSKQKLLVPPIISPAHTIIWKRGRTAVTESKNLKVEGIFNRKKAYEIWGSFDIWLWNAYAYSVLIAAWLGWHIAM